MKRCMNCIYKKYGEINVRVVKGYIKKPYWYMVCTRTLIPLMVFNNITIHDMLDNKTHLKKMAECNCDKWIEHTSK